jgi:hypothetical protein
MTKFYDVGASLANHKWETTGCINAYFEMFSISKIDVLM